jgi:hypothetical protein
MDHASLVELRDIRKHNDRTNELLEQIFYKTQSIEADKVPDGFKAYYTTIKTDFPIMLLPASDLRHEFLVFNNGSDDLALMDQAYDPSVFSGYATVINNYIPVLVLPSGQSIKFKLNAMIFGYNLGTSGSTVNIIETTFSNLPNTKYYFDHIAAEIQGVSE